jgi:hypothetical protein
MATNKQFINVFDDPMALYDFCVENQYTDCKTYEEWFDGGGDLTFFEGDPDMIKVNGEIGYFCECGDVVFFYFDDWGDHNAETILKGFFGAFQTGITLGGNSWISGDLPKGCSDDQCLQNWEMWDKIQTGIAYRGGAGYFYTIQSWGNYIRYNS